MTPKEMASLIRKRKGKIIRALQNTLYSTVQHFSADIIRLYYSGRPGLKRQTGTLARGWRVNAWGWGEGVDFTVSLRNSEKYGPVHEYGHPGYWVRPGAKGLLAWKNKTEYITRGGKLRSKADWVFTTKPVFIRIPKRTNVMGEWKNFGRVRVATALHATLQRELQA